MTDHKKRPSQRQAGARKRQRKEDEDEPKRKLTEEEVEEEVPDGLMLQRRHEDDVDVEWEIPETPQQMSYFEGRISTIIGEMDRLLQQNPRQYFERIMVEISAWKKAGEPTLSPHYVALDIFEAFASNLETMRRWTMSVLGPVYHSVQIYNLWRLANYLAHSISEIGRAVEKDEKLKKEEKLEYRHAHGQLQFQSDRLLTLYDEAGLSP